MVVRNYVKSTEKKKALKEVEHFTNDVDITPILAICESAEDIDFTVDTSNDLFHSYED
jgi:hypothetical protein